MEVDHAINPTVIPLKKVSNKLYIKTKYVNYIITKSDIAYLKAENNYCHIQLANGNNILCSCTLKEVHERIQSSDFHRIHKSYVINLNNVMQVCAYYGNVTMADTTSLPVSRGMKASLKAVISKMFD